MLVAAFRPESAGSRDMASLLPSAAPTLQIFAWRSTAPISRSTRSTCSSSSPALTGKKKPEAAVKDAQRRADEIMLPYVQSTALGTTGG
jgi:hypothetical protein